MWSDISCGYYTRGFFLFGHNRKIVLGYYVGDCLRFGGVFSRTVIFDIGTVVKNIKTPLAVLIDQIKLDLVPDFGAPSGAFIIKRPMRERDIIG